MPLSALLDLDKLKQSFILETKRIHIPDYPDAFNPSIVSWKGKILMSFRSRDANGCATLVRFTWLNQDFEPIGTPMSLKIKKGTYIQDPRLFTIKNRLYMAYSDLIGDQRTMCMAELKFEGNGFLAVHVEYFLDFHGIKNNKFEKNWVPFDYEGLILYSYTLSPHKVFLPIAGENKCVTIVEGDDYYPWHWGTMRGGTPALLIDNYYLAFFHSSISLETVQSRGEKMPHYFMGAYAFERNPPFSIRKISPDPIVSKSFYNGETYKTWKPLQVVFPCGIIYDDPFLWVSYGRQDHEAWVVKIDKGKLLKTLISLN